MNHLRRSMVQLAMPRILLIDDDESCLATTAAILRVAGHDVAVERTGLGGVRAASQFSPDAALIDLRLPDISGLQVLDELRVRRPGVRCLLITGFADLDTAIEALRHGACDYLQKPVWDVEIVAAVNNALGQDSTATVRVSFEGHDTRRWAEAIVSFIDAPRDAKSLFEFGREIGIAVGTFRTWCRAAVVSPRQSLRFARGLRAVIWQVRDAPPQRLLNIVDPRTLSKFLSMSGGTNDRLPTSIEEFLQRQRYIKNADAVNAVKSLLSSRAANGRSREM